MFKIEYDKSIPDINMESLELYLVKRKSTDNISVVFKDIKTDKVYYFERDMETVSYSSTEFFDMNYTVIRPINSATFN